VINYREQQEAAQRVVEAICLSGGEAVAIAGDVSRESEASGLVAQTVTRWGRLDVLVNNAGVTSDSLLVRTRTEEWHRVLDTNLNGAFLTTRAAVKQMIRQRGGRVINISSVVGLSGQAGQSNYAAAKAGLIGFSKSLALELAPREILVNVVAPGLIVSDMSAAMTPSAREALMGKIPLGRPGQPEEVASLATQGSYVTGQVFVVDGGLHM
jgi:3-oxoacyl-[acyl-carrier protein] reductase